jgi:hypothetical protein
MTEETLLPLETPSQAIVPAPDPRRFPVLVVGTGDAFDAGALTGAIDVVESLNGLTRRAIVWWRYANALLDARFSTAQLATRA